MRNFGLGLSGRSSACSRRSRPAKSTFIDDLRARLQRRRDELGHLEAAYSRLLGSGRIADKLANDILGLQIDIMRLEGAIADAVEGEGNAPRAGDRTGSPDARPADSSSAASDAAVI